MVWPLDGLVMPFGGIAWAIDGLPKGSIGVRRARAEGIGRGINPLAHVNDPRGACPGSAWPLPCIGIDHAKVRPSLARCRRPCGTQALTRPPVGNTRTAGAAKEVTRTPSIHGPATGGVHERVTMGTARGIDGYCHWVLVHGTASGPSPWVHATATAAHGQPHGHSCPGRCRWPLWPGVRADLYHSAGSPPEARPRVAQAIE